jgi:hypothetical protein
VLSSALECAGYIITVVKRSADTCYKGEKGITRGVTYPKDKESVQKRKEVIINLIKVELRRS